MAEPYCEKWDLPVSGCAHCRGIDSIDEVEQVRLDEDRRQIEGRWTP